SPAARPSRPGVRRAARARPTRPARCSRNSVAPAVTHLNLWKQHLGRVPESVWDETDLETLVLADNSLSEISDRLGGLKRLRMLDVGHNQLTRVPDSIGDLDELTDFLYLHDNRITSL